MSADVFTSKQNLRKHSTVQEIFIFFSFSVPHYKLRDFLPGKVGTLLFSKVKNETSDGPGLDNDSTMNSFEDTKPLSSELKCTVCQETFGEKLALTDHIVEHYREEISEKFIENGIKCRVCQYTDANLGQLTKHVALQHEKIREYLGPAEGDHLFALINNEPSPPGVIETKPPSFDCYICAKAHKTRSDLRQHIFCHLRHEIQAKFYPDTEHVKLCVECNYKSSTGEHVLMHLALKHQKLSEFVPPEVAAVLYNSKRGRSSKSLETSPNQASAPVI